MSPSLSQTLGKRPLFEPESHGGCDNANHPGVSDFINLSSHSHCLSPRKKQRFGTGVRGRGENRSRHEKVQSLLPIRLLRSVPSKDSREHSPGEWELHKSTIQRLYVAERRKLREVMEIMNRDYGFAATQRQFKRKISVWRFDKNIKSHEMEAIVRKKIQRMVAERKQSTFRLRGVPVEEAKINRYLRGKESSFLTIRIPSPGIATPSALSCYTPTECSTPPPSQEWLNIQSIHNSLASLAQKMASRSTPMSSQSSSKLTSRSQERNVSPVTSGYSPHLYTPLHVVDDVPFRPNRFRIALQRIVYILCTMASASREEIMSGESWRVIEYIDRVLSLGCDDANTAAGHYLAMSNSIVGSAFGWDFGDNVIEHYLSGICNLLAAQGLGVNKGQVINLSDGIHSTDPWRPLGLEEQFVSFVTGFDLSASDSVPDFTGSLSPFNEELMDIDTTSWCLDNASTYQSFINEEKHWNLESLRRSSDSEPPSSLPSNRCEALSEPIYTVRERRDSFRRLSTFTFSQPTAFGVVDVILQIHSLSSDLKHAMGHDNGILEDLFAASIIITPFEHSIAASQMIFNLTPETCFNGLSTPALLFRPTLPYLSEVFRIAGFGTPHELKKMLHEGKASLSDCDWDGRSLLNYALCMRNVEMCKFLLDTGADANAFEPGIRRLSPILSLLLNFDYHSDRSKTPACFQLMLEAGADPSSLEPIRKYNGTMFCSIFSLVLPIANLHTLKLLLDLGNPFITSNSTGNSELEYPPILILAASCYEDVGFYDTADKFVLLIQRSADIHARDADGKNCLHILMENGGPTHREQMYDVLMVLLTAGADVYATTKDGRTVSYFARKHGYGDLWRQVLGECGYDTRTLLVSSRPPLVFSRPHFGLYALHEEVYPRQRCKLSFEEYCRRRSLSSRFEELDSDDECHGSEDDDTAEYDDEGCEDGENEKWSRGYAGFDSDENRDENEGADITNGENYGKESRLQESGDGVALEHRIYYEGNEEQDFRKLFYLDNWDLMEY